jgi:hypothetical protein
VYSNGDYQYGFPLHSYVTVVDDIAIIARFPDVTGITPRFPYFHPSRIAKVGQPSFIRAATPLDSHLDSTTTTSLECCIPGWIR